MSAEFDDELAADLRQATERELRWEAEDVEADVAQGVARARTLADIAAELMARGDEITAGWGHTFVTGHITHARGDLAVVESGHGAASLNLAGPVVIKVVTRARRGGVSVAAGGSRSFRGRLAEFEHTGETVRIVSTHSEETLEGRITVAARDHVALVNRQGTEWFVPHLVIAMVLQGISPSRR